MSNGSWGDDNIFVLWAASQSISSLANRACGCRTPPVSVGQGTVPIRRQLLRAKLSMVVCVRRKAELIRCLCDKYELTHHHRSAVDKSWKQDSWLPAETRLWPFPGLSDLFRWTNTHTRVLYTDQSWCHSHKLLRLFLSYLPGARYLIKIIIST